MKKIIAIMLILVLTLCMFAGCGSSGEDEKIVLTWGEVNPDEHPMAQGAFYFKELVEEATDGRITVEVYTSGLLGDEKTSMQATQIGTMDIFRGNATTMEDYGAGLFSALALPYVFTGVEHQYEYLRTDAADDILASAQESGSGFVATAFLEEGPRNLFFTKQAASTLSDIQGLMIRVPETDLMMRTFEALGSNPTPISYSELYTALSTGMVDGAENAITGYVTNSFYEVAPYYVKDAHTFGQGVILFSEKTWNELSAEDQELMLWASKETQDYVYEITMEVEDEYYAMADELGFEVIEVTDIENWSASCVDLYAEYSQEVQDIIAEVQSYA